MSRNHSLALSLLFPLILASCGQADPGQKTSPSLGSTEETCDTAGCTEKTINAPVGAQVEEAAEVYDLVATNPNRSTLRFPAFDSRWGLKREIYDKAVRYFGANQGSISNPRYFMIVDFNLHSSKKRLFLFDLSNDSVERHNVAAGKNSDPNADGFATAFSNSMDSKMSSLGFYKTLQTYVGKHGLSLRLAGLSSTNSNAFDRDVVIHAADYVSDSQGKAGRSWGCPAVDPVVAPGLIQKVKNGAILLIDR